MSADVTRFLAVLSRSPFWYSPKELCACKYGDSPALAGLDVVWFFRQSHRELGNDLCLESLVGQYLRTACANLRSPNLAFDEFWYRQTYPEADIAVRHECYRSGWEHYLAEGARAGNNPAFWFDEQCYARQIPEVRPAISAGTLLCGFEHYLREGVRTYVLPSIYFNPRWYAEQYLRDDAACRIPIIDYLTKDRNSRPIPVPFFDEPWYRCQYLARDGAISGHGSAYEHYIFLGRSQGHSASPNFNESAYRARYPDVMRLIAQGVYRSGFEHYASVGLINGYLASSHHPNSGIDYRNPSVVKSYEKSLQLNLKQVAQIRELICQIQADNRSLE